MLTSYIQNFLVFISATIRYRHIPELAILLDLKFFNHGTIQHKIKNETVRLNLNEKYDRYMDRSIYF